jgi:hypothetical protein
MLESQSLLEKKKSTKRDLTRYWPVLTISACSAFTVVALEEKYAVYVVVMAFVSVLLQLPLLRCRPKKLNQSIVINTHTLKMHFTESQKMVDEIAQMMSAYKEKIDALQFQPTTVTVVQSNHPVTTSESLMLSRIIQEGIVYRGEILDRVLQSKPVTEKELQSLDEVMQELYTAGSTLAEMLDVKLGCCYERLQTQHQRMSVLA